MDAPGRPATRPPPGQRPPMTRPAPVAGWAPPPGPPRRSPWARFWAGVAAASAVWACALAVVALALSGPPADATAADVPAWRLSSLPYDAEMVVGPSSQELVLFGAEGGTVRLDATDRTGNWHRYCVFGIDQLAAVESGEGPVACWHTREMAGLPGRTFSLDLDLPAGQYGVQVVCLDGREACNAHVRLRELPA